MLTDIGFKNFTKFGGFTEESEDLINVGAYAFGTNQKVDKASQNEQLKLSKFLQKSETELKIEFGKRALYWNASPPSRLIINIYFDKYLLFQK